VSTAAADDDVEVGEVVGELLLPLLLLLLSLISWEVI
jgi:hypothetical protein